MLGGTGMLGSMLVDELSRQVDLEVHATVRTGVAAGGGSAAIDNVGWAVLDAETATDAEIREMFEGAAWVINAIGVIKPYIDDANANQRRRALLVNGLFPYRLATAAQETGACVLQIATDCVFSGIKGAYTEHDHHDALDVYGKSKSLGEVPSASLVHLRCSIVGPEVKSHASLLDWFLGQPNGAEVKGYTDHLWNGITTLHFAKLCVGVVRSGLPIEGIHHVLPGGTVSKADLLRIFAGAFDRTDVQITPERAPVALDRTLATNDPEMNARLWSSAGYDEPPTIAAMVGELADFDLRLKGGVLT